LDNNNPFSLAGKTILVTGASSGIGRAVAVECSRMGANLVITARNEERLNDTLIKMDGIGHFIISADLSKDDERNRLVENTPALEGLVHCAGIVKTLPFQFINEESLKMVIDINFNAPALLSALLVKQKKMVRNSSIVFISSISGNVCVWGGNSLYSASKAAINGLMKNMAFDLATKGIRVNSINPGMVDTKIVNEGIISREQLVEDAKRYPLKRYGKPEEVAWAVVYLLSDASAWITGSSLLIDGGYTLL
jgi:NAD(P)-dependent dehydrogenase (short-subunit alcohol dehydrogenase family)